jgi:RHS repeat-associated protein
MDYFPYGKILRQFIKTPEKYVTTGHERDVETGLDYRGARFYDSDVARFLSLDPLAAEFPEWSDYNYVLGNPVMFVDPDGRDVKPGENWKGSDYEKVYNKLRKNSKAYSNLLKPYEGKGARDYTLNNKGELGIRTAYTSPDFNKHDTNEEAFVRNYVSKEPNSEWRLHMQSTFVRNAEMKEIGGEWFLNDDFVFELSEQAKERLEAMKAPEERNLEQNKSRNGPRVREYEETLDDGTSINTWKAFVALSLSNTFDGAASFTFGK